VEALRESPRRLAALVAAIVLVVIVIVIVFACGSTEEEARQRLDRAFSTPIGSADVSLDASVDVQGVRQLEQPLRLQVRGPYQSGGGRRLPSVDFAVNLTAQGQSFAAGLISTGNNAWVQFLGQAYEVGESNVERANQQIAAGQQQRRGRSLQALGVDPRRWLDNPAVEGEETVAGIETTHISAGVDVPVMLEDINRVSRRAGGQVGAPAPQPLTQEQRERVERVVQDPEFDVYVGQDNKVRRLSTVINLDVPEEDRRALGGAERGKIAFSIEFSNVGRPQTITPPRDARPIRDLTEQIARMLGAQGGGGGQGGALPQPTPGGGGQGGALPQPTPGG
jgi:hypothetical protein